MPVVTFPTPELLRLLGRQVDVARLAERMPMIGGDLDHADEHSITIEWFPDRPDLLPITGTARALRAFLDIAPGMPKYPVREGTDRLLIDPAVAKVRPFAALARVQGVKLGDGLPSLIEAQEKLTLAMGRRRRKVAIGLHDAKGVQGPFTYTVATSKHAFVPLGGDKAATPQEILRTHPKGQAYGHLVPGPVPVFLDGEGKVLSMPPIINAARTAVTESTTEFLIDVTGTDEAAVRRTMALLAADLAERGGTLLRCTVAGTDARHPDLRPEERVIHADDVGALLGIALDGEAIAVRLRRMGHDAEAFGNRIVVQVPPWRFDILHDVDLIEDVAIGHGFENFKGRDPSHPHQAVPLPSTAPEELLRDTLAGLGFLEAKTLTLTNARADAGHWGAKAPAAVRLANPVTEEQTQLRRRILPGLLGVLAENKHRALPQRLFEAGFVVAPTKQGWQNRRHLAVVEAANRVNVADMAAVLRVLGRVLAREFAVQAAEVEGYIDGRAATIHEGGTIVGRIGEVHPDTILAFDLHAPLVALELDG